MKPCTPRFTSRAIVLGVVLLVLVISYASSLRAWLDQRSQIDEARQRIVSLRQQVDDLEREQRRWADEAYVEQQARDDQWRCGGADAMGHQERAHQQECKQAQQDRNAREGADRVLFHDAVSDGAAGSP